jgi:TPR repeat protein
MVKYYLMAIEKDNVDSMYNLGSYYERIKNYNLMEKYYLIAIEKGDIDAMNNLNKHIKSQLDDYVII